MVELNTPPLWKRFVAYLIDLYFIFLLFYMLSLALPENTTDLTKQIFIVLLFLYDPICNSTLGVTFGAFLFKIRVRKLSDLESKIGFPQAVFRFILKLLLGWLSFLTVHSNEKKQALHDIAINSVVINKKS